MPVTIRCKGGQSKLAGWSWVLCPRWTRRGAAVLPGRERGSAEVVSTGQTPARLAAFCLRRLWEACASVLHFRVSPLPLQAPPTPPHPAAPGRAAWALSRLRRPLLACSLEPVWSERHNPPAFRGAPSEGGHLQWCSLGVRPGPGLRNQNQGWVPRRDSSRHAGAPCWVSPRGPAPTQLGPVGIDPKASAHTRVLLGSGLV